MKRLSVSLALVAFIALAPARATAALITFTTSGCGGFENCSNAAFDAAIGVPDVDLSFSVDKFGNPAPAGQISGTSFSDLVTFSTAPSALNLTGSANVMAGGSGISSEIGPVPNFNGILRIDFASPATAVGFGTVELEISEQIRIYDQFGALIGTFGGVSDDFFNYFGVIGTNGTLIGRVELEGLFFAIQDLQATLAVVPEPATVLLLGTGVVVAASRRRRRA